MKHTIHFLGTTTTGLLAALSTTGAANFLHDALLISFVHMFFNIFGILIFYPIPMMRYFLPINRKIKSYLH